MIEPISNLTCVLKRLKGYTTTPAPGASSASAGAIHYAQVLPPAMPIAGPRRGGSAMRAAKSKYAPGVVKAHLRRLGFRV